MPTLDIFNDDAFSMASLTKGIEDIPHVPGRIGSLGLFFEEGITTTSVQIESDGTTLSLVPASERGGIATPVLGDKRKMRPFNTFHLPEVFTVRADEIQNVRAFGTDSEVETVLSIVNKRIRKALMKLSATHEFQRIGCIQGKIYDANGTSVLLDLFQEFGLTQQTVAVSLGSNTDVRLSCLDVEEAMESALGGLSFSGGRVFCGSSFWRSLLSNDDFKSSYLNTAQASELRGDARVEVPFGGLVFERYRGGIGGTPFIPATEAYAVPEGVQDLFLTNFAPPDFIDAANTIGMPYYVQQEFLEMKKGIKGEVQSNPLHICTRPRACIKLTA